MGFKCWPFLRKLMFWRAKSKTKIGTGDSNKKDLNNDGKVRTLGSKGSENIDYNLLNKELNPPLLSQKGYVVGKRIGQGAYGSVYLAEQLKPVKRKLAVKVIVYNQVNEDWLNEKMKDELKIAAKLKHVNVIDVYDQLKTKNRVFIFMERARCTLDDVIHVKYPNGIPEERAKEYFFQAMRAVEYIHAKGVAHRDIKTDNILFSYDGHIKITDLGMATYMNDKKLNHKLSSTNCGTLGYKAPELLAPSPKYDASKADMWSMGVVLYLMLTGKKPFEHFENADELFLKEVKGNVKFPSNIPISKNATKLIKKLLDPNPDKRPTAHDVMEDVWFQDVKLFSHVNI